MVKFCTNGTRSGHRKRMVCMTEFCTNNALHGHKKCLKCGHSLFEGDEDDEDADDISKDAMIKVSQRTLLT